MRQELSSSTLEGSQHGWDQMIRWSKDQMIKGSDDQKICGPEQKIWWSLNQCWKCHCNEAAKAKAKKMVSDCVLLKVLLGCAVIVDKN